MNWISKSVRKHLTNLFRSDSDISSTSSWNRFVQVTIRLRLGFANRCAKQQRIVQSVRYTCIPKMTRKIEFQGSYYPPRQSPEFRGLNPVMMSFLGKKFQSPPWKLFRKASIWSGRYIIRAKRWANIGVTGYTKIGARRYTNRDRTGTLEMKLRFHCDSTWVIF